MRGISVIIMNLTSLIINVLLFKRCLPNKKPLPFIIFSFAAVTVLLLVINRYTAYLARIPLPNGLIYLPLLLVLFEGNVFQKLFMYFLMVFVNVSLYLFASMTLGFFMPYGSEQFYIMELAAVVILYIVSAVIVYRHSKLFMSRLFKQWSRQDWTLYMLSATIAYIVVFILRRAYTGNNIVQYSTLIFVMWSFVILCYAIINTHEKSKQKYEADLAREIITSGQGHYQKMNELFSALQIMRHDSKHHMNVVLEFLYRGDTDKAIEYLGGQQNVLSKYELDNFCSNQILNALLVNFADKCKRSGIDFSAGVAIPKNSRISDYDMCIVTGNLLENAFEASLELTDGRKIRLDMKMHNEQFILKVENFFRETAITENQDRKEGRGLGLRSVQLVTARYGGELMIKHDGDTFIASVLM